MTVLMEPSAYRGTLIFCGAEYPFRAAVPKDAEELAKLYQSVAITKDNYREKLEPGSADFSKTGGMFLIHNQESILLEMASGQSLFAVLENPEKAIVAMLWVSGDDPAFAAYTPEEREALVFAREIIVSPGSLPTLSSVMYYTVFAYLWRMGFTHSVGEVYKVIAYEDSGGEHICHLLNERSMASIVRTGAVFGGQNPLREIFVERVPFTARVEPQIVHFAYDRVVPTLENILKEAGLAVNFKGVEQ